MLNHEIAVTFASLGFLGGLIIGLASCSGDDACAQLTTVERVQR